MAAQRDDGGPALPHGNPEKPDGMTLRDYFAAKAMVAYIQENYAQARHQDPVGDGGVPWDDEDVATFAYIAADAMLKARQS